MKIFTRKYPDSVVNPDCSEFEVSNLIISKFVLKELVPIVGIKPYPLNELMLMTAAVCRFRPTHIFEWGTYLGKSARIFYEIISHFRIPCEVYSIDLPDNIPHPEHAKWLRGLYVKNIPIVKLLLGDGLKAAMNIYKKIQPKSYPFFFLDGDHKYVSVKRELQVIIKEIPHAVVLVHDTFFQSSQSKYNTGPFRAVQVVLRSISRKYKIISVNTGLPGMTLIYPHRKKAIIL